MPPWREVEKDRNRYIWIFLSINNDDCNWFFWKTNSLQCAGYFPFYCYWL